MSAWLRSRPAAAEREPDEELRRPFERGADPQAACAPARRSDGRRVRAYAQLQERWRAPAVSRRGPARAQEADHAPADLRRRDDAVRRARLRSRDGLGDRARSSASRRRRCYNYFPTKESLVFDVPTKGSSDGGGAARARAGRVADEGDGAALTKSRRNSTSCPTRCRCSCRCSARWSRRRRRCTPPGSSCTRGWSRWRREALAE